MLREVLYTRDNHKASLRIKNYINAISLCETYAGLSNHFMPADRAIYLKPRPDIAHWQARLRRALPRSRSQEPSQDLPARVLRHGVDELDPAVEPLVARHRRSDVLRYQRPHQLLF
jgi:hypothetical protein